MIRSRISKGRACEGAAFLFFVGTADPMASIYHLA